MQVTDIYHFYFFAELEVQDIVKVNVTSNEDIFAVKVLNLYRAVHSLLAGVPVCREIPIFGAPFGKGVFLMGMIDEIRCDSDTLALDIFEFKTRNLNSLPSKAQKTTHELQVMMYKKLFDDLILGNTTKEMLRDHMHVDLHEQLGEDILKHILDLGLVCNTLDLLLNNLLGLLKCTTCISQIFIEYCYQKENTTIAITEVCMSDQWLQDRFVHYISYWEGRRSPLGVDIEDAWKCGRCDFSEICEWRAKKQQECMDKQTKGSNR